MTDDEMFPVHECSVLVIAGNKGGVGKTSASLNLSCAFAAAGRKVLFIDLDPQGSGTAALRGSFFMSDSGNGIGSALLLKKALNNFIVHYETGHFDCIFADAELSDFPLLCRHFACKEHLLLKALQPLRAFYDFIIIDCPPSLNDITVNALCAGDEFIVPVVCDCPSVEGLRSVLNLYADLKRKRLSAVNFMGAFRTMFDRHHPFAASVSEQLKESFGNMIFATSIPFTSRISEAPAAGRPVILYDRSSIGAKGYLSLAGEISVKIKARKRLLNDNNADSNESYRFIV